MKINLKSKKGFTTVDLSIAMIVLLIFVVIMTSISYSVYLSSMEAKRTATALNYAVDIFEHIGVVSFSEVTANASLLDIEDLQGIEVKETTTSNGTGIIKASIGTYNITLKIQDYKNGGIVKLITLTMEYPVSRKKTEKIEFQKVKAVETSSQTS